MMHGNMNIRRR